MTNLYPDAETRRAYLDTIVDDHKQPVRAGMAWMQARMDAYMSEQNLELVKTLHDILGYSDDDAVRSRIEALMVARKGHMNMGDLCRLDGWLHRDSD